jgi:type IV pilus assembly protein PilA
MKKGFTLIELLAVIIILAILMIIAVPNILNTLATARKNAFVTQAQSIYKSAEQQFTINSMNNQYYTCFSNAGDHKLDLGSLSSTLQYKVTVNSVTGKVESIDVLDTGQGFRITLTKGSNEEYVSQNAIVASAVGTDKQSETVTQCA